MPFTPGGTFFPEGANLHPSADWWQQHAITGDATALSYANAARWGKGNMPLPADVGLYRLAEHAGVWAVPTTAAAEQITGLPVTTPGALTVAWIAGAGAGVATQEYATSGLLGAADLWRRAVIDAVAGTWTEWTKLPAKDWRRGDVPPGADVTVWGTAHTGVWAVRTYAIAASIIGLPVAAPGTLTMQAAADSNHTVSWLYSGHAGSGLWWRAAANDAGALSDWVRLDSSTGPIDAGDTGLRNRVLGQAFARRRGGTIGTDGRAVVCLRIDHGMNGVAAHIAPLAEQYSIPLSVAVYEKMHDPAYRGAENSAMPWAAIDTAMVNQGWEIWNHSATHLDASGTTALTREIVTARDSIAAALPRAKIEGFAIPGTGGTDYDGFSTDTLNESRWFEYEAGRLIMSAHAVSTGHGSITFPIAGQGPWVGLPFYAIDQDAAAAAAHSIVTDAALTGSGVCLMLHGYAVDRNPGEVTTATLATLFAFLAAERDAGRIEILTLGGALVADINSPHRDTLLRNGSFAAGLAKWSNTTGWTAASGVASGTSSAGLLRQSLTIAPNTRWALGSIRELYAEARSTTGAVITTAVNAFPAGPALAASRDHALPADGEWHPVRLPAMIPATGTDVITVDIGRASGGAVELRNIALRAI